MYRGGGGEVFSHYRNDAGLQTYCLQLRFKNSFEDLYQSGRLFQSSVVM